MFWIRKFSNTLCRHEWNDIEYENKKYYQCLRVLEDIFDFNNLNENHELLSKKNKKVIGKLK